MKDFDSLYDELLEKEARLKEVLTSYATGGSVPLSNADKTFKEIKDILKKIRRLAKEAEEKKVL